jgi:hypothetical protein
MRGGLDPEPVGRPLKTAKGEVRAEPHPLARGVWRGTRRRLGAAAGSAARRGAVTAARILAEIVGEPDPELVRETLIRIARGEEQVEPCFWFYIVVAMGREAKEELGTSIPKCVVCEAVRRIVLDSVDPNRRNWISLDKPANLVMQYARRHRCQQTEAGRRLVVQHARIVSAYTREWVRVLADGVNGLAEHQSVSQSVLYGYLSGFNCCR